MKKQTGSRLCFFISPIGEPTSGERRAADLVLKHLVRKSLEPLGYEVIRADEDNYPGLITTRVISLIATAELIVADLTGSNPNVFYEIAVAHGYKRPIVHILRAGDSIPFDVRDMRILPYNMQDLDELEIAKQQLAVFAEQAIANVDDQKTPLSIAGGFAPLGLGGDPIALGQAQLIDLIGELRAELRDAFSPATQQSSLDREASEAGVRRLEVGGVLGDDFVQRLGSASILRIMATSAYRLVEVQSNVLMRALANGCDIRLLLADPDQGFVADVQEMETEDVPRYTNIADEIRSVDVRLSKILESAAELALNERAPVRLGTVSIGYFSTQFRSTVILVDQTWGWLTLTLPPARAIDSPSLELVNSGKRPLLIACIKHFDRVWQVLERREKIHTLTTDLQA
jgi:hypothetical protein